MGMRDVPSVFTGIFTPLTLLPRLAETFIGNALADIRKSQALANTLVDLSISTLQSDLSRRDSFLHAYFPSPSSIKGTSPMSVSSQSSTVGSASPLGTSYHKRSSLTVTFEAYSDHGRSLTVNAKGSVEGEVVKLQSVEVVDVYNQRRRHVKVGEGAERRAEGMRGGRRVIDVKSPRE